MPPTRPPTGGGGALGGGLPLPAKILIGVLAVAFAAVGYFVLFYGEVDAQMTAENNRATNLKGELAKAQESNKAYQADLEEKSRREKLAQEQKKILPDEAETPAFLAAVQGVATVSGVNLTSFTPKDEIADQFYARVPMELTMSGRFHQIARFFYGVGQLDRIINVEDIEMTRRGASKRGNVTEESAEVILDVKCLTTAFRAIKAGESGQTGKPSRKRGG
jgi:type IV pilus assembly protein PilO